MARHGGSRFDLRELVLAARLEELHAITGRVVHQDLAAAYADGVAAVQKGGYSENCQKPLLLGAS